MRLLFDLWYADYFIRATLFNIGYHFTATGAHITEDACGSKEKLSQKLLSGYHGSGLSLDFRSNRIHSKDGFYLGITCTLPSKTIRKKRADPSVSISGSSSQSLRSRRDTDKPITAKEYFVRYSHCYTVYLLSIVVVLVNELGGSFQRFLTISYSVHCENVLTSQPLILIGAENINRSSSNVSQCMHACVSL